MHARHLSDALPIVWERCLTLFAWLGRYATAALLGGVALGLAFPQLAGWLNGALAEIVFVFVVVSFLKVDGDTLAYSWRAPLLPAILLVWCLIGLPLIVAGSARALSLSPDFSQALIVWAASPPMTSAIVFAMLLRLDLPLAVAGSIISLFIVPFTGPLMLALLSDQRMQTSSLALVGQIAWFIGSAILIAALIRRAVGKPALVAHHDALGGLIILTLVPFAACLTMGVGEQFAKDPWRIIQFVATGFVTNIAAQLATVLLFWQFGSLQRVTGALLAGNRNMSVLCANLGPAMTLDIGLFFAASHVAIYTLPWLLRGFYRAQRAEPAGARGSAPR
jgi:predicted Na+-dependent transporter